MHNKLAIKALSAHTCLGKGAAFSAAAMRCGYDGFEETTFAQPHSIDRQLGAMIEAENGLRGLAKLISLCRHSVEEMHNVTDENFSNIPLFICLQEIQRPGAFEVDELQEKLFRTVKERLGLSQIHPRSRAYLKGRVGFAYALKDAQEDLYANVTNNVLILSVDSLLNSATLSYYGGDMYGEGCRLLTDNNSNGFIPGEAATAILLSKPTGKENEIIISGVGTAKETATIYNEEELLRGKGLSEAIMKASSQANIPIHETSFRVGSMSGEEYFFDESTLAQIKTLKQKIPVHPLWHPSDNIGEVGAAIGGAMVIQTYYAMLKGYAPGDNAICHISNDDELRGAFIMQHTHKKSIQKHNYIDSLEGMYFSDTIKSQLKHDAPYAWFLLRRSQQSPLFNQHSLDTLQERLDAYVECFILSEKAGDSLLDTLNMSDWGAVYVAARVGLVCEDEGALRLAIESIQTQQQSIELSDALTKDGYANTKILIEKLIGDKNPWVRVSAIETLKRQRIALHDTLINILLEDEAQEVQAAIAQLIGEYKLHRYKPAIEQALEHPDEYVRYHTTYAGCLLQIPQAYRTLQNFCFRPNPYLKNALGILYHVIKEEHIVEILHKVSDMIPSSRIKAYNLAMAGLPEAIPLLLKQMENIEDAKYCAEAFSIITGVDLDKEDLTREEPLSDEEEELLIRTQQEDPWTSFYEDDLPLPDTKLLTQWWQKHQERFETGTRYLSGKRLTQENLHEIITYGNQVQRSIAKTILALKYPQDVDLSDEIFHVDFFNKIGKRDKMHKAKQYAPRTGAYQAFLPKGHKDEERLIANPFAYNTYNAGDRFTYEGLEEFDISLIEWRMREEDLK